MDRSTGSTDRYRDFWTDVGAHFPDLGGARSTAQYLEDEQWLFRRYLSPLNGRRILKTDLWDEAKNTRILCWAAEAGAKTFGVDISPPTVARARRHFGDRNLSLNGLVSDVRSLPFPAASFDAVYSMGTIEHFAESETALQEIFRVLRPGGLAIIGVPNRWDPFLRPLLVTLLYRVGLYGYGYEKSYSRRALRNMVERTGLGVGPRLTRIRRPFAAGKGRRCRPGSHRSGRPMRPDSTRGRIAGSGLPSGKSGSLVRHRCSTASPTA